MITSAGVDTGKVGLLSTVGRNISWCSCFKNQCSGLSKTKNNAQLYQTLCHIPKGQRSLHIHVINRKLLFLLSSQWILGYPLARQKYPCAGKGHRDESLQRQFQGTTSTLLHVNTHVYSERLWLVSTLRQIEYWVLTATLGRRGSLKETWRAQTPQQARLLQKSIFCLQEHGAPGFLFRSPGAR